MNKNILHATPEEIREAMKTVRPSHKNTQAVIERIAELQIARFGLTDTVEEYIKKSSARITKKAGK